MINLPDSRRYSLPATIEYVLRSAMRSWPRAPGSGRALKPQEFHPVAAATHAAQIETYKADPHVINRFLQKDVWIENVDEDHVEAFWSLMRELRKEPSAVDPRFHNPATTLEYLREEGPRRRAKLRRQRYYADRKYVVTVNMQEIHPTDIPNLPDKRVKGKYALKEPRDSSSEIEELLGWWTEEDEARFLREAQRVLPRRQFQVLERGFRGRRDEEIAHDLGIRETTVRDHRASAKRNEALRSLVKKWIG